MKTKPKKPSKPEVGLKRKDVQVEVRKDDTEEVKAEKLARVILSPEFAAYRVVSGAERNSNVLDDADVPSIVDVLRAQAAAVSRGEMNHVEAMLMNQAAGLQSLFARLAERGMGCEHAAAFEANMRMALRAQNQCRATLETMVAIKNPPVVFAKQANINQGGNQQVNNGTLPPASHAEKTINQQNELLTEGAQHGATVDNGRTGAAIGANQELEAVGAIQRA